MPKIPHIPGRRHSISGASSAGQDSYRLVALTGSAARRGGSTPQRVDSASQIRTASPALPIVIHRIEIASRRGLRDARGAHAAGQIRDFLHIDVGGVRTRDVYHLEAELEADELERVVRELTDPVQQMGAVGRVDDGPFDAAIAVAYKPGVADPVGRSALVAIEDTLGRPLGDGAAVYSSVLYLLDGVDRAAAERISAELLANPAIQTARVATGAEWAGAPPDLSVPRVAGGERPAVQTLDLSGDDAELERISRDGAAGLVARGDGRHPRPLPPPGHRSAPRRRRPRRRTHRRRAGVPGPDLERALQAQDLQRHDHLPRRRRAAARRSARCSTPTSAARPGRSTPSCGAATAPPGWSRCSTTTPAWWPSTTRSTWSSRWRPTTPLRPWTRTAAPSPASSASTATPSAPAWAPTCWSTSGATASPRRSSTASCRRACCTRGECATASTAGVIDGGNQSGVPYGRGWELFDDRYLGKPLVFCGTVGALPVTSPARPGEQKAARPGDAVVMVGGRIGADGIHGATFSSAALDESSPVQAVQIGDPITQKRMFDFLLEARELGLYYGHHRQRRRRPVLLGRRDGRDARRRQARPDPGAAEVRRAWRLGDPSSPRPRSA